MSLDVVSVSARVAAVHSCTCACAQVTQIHIGRSGGRCCCHMCTSCFQTTHICASSSPVSAGESRRPAYTLQPRACLPIAAYNIHSSSGVQHAASLHRLTRVKSTQCSRAQLRSICLAAFRARARALQPSARVRVRCSLPRTCACAAAFRVCACAAAFRARARALQPSARARTRPKATHALVPSTNARRPHPTGRMEPEKKRGPLVD